MMMLWENILCAPIIQNACGHSEYIPDDAQVERWKRFREKVEDNQGELLVPTQDDLTQASKPRQVVQQDKRDEQREGLEEEDEYECVLQRQINENKALYTGQKSAPALSIVYSKRVSRYLQ
jgi:hypothetical protein